MIAVVQRVTRAAVHVEGRTVGEIRHGLVALAALTRDDNEREMGWMAGKIAGLRVFASEKGAFDRDVREVGGAVLLVSNFTVAALTATGRRPGLSPAMSPELAKPAFETFVELVRGQGVVVATGLFGADMSVEIHNDGPITLIIDSKARGQA
jgi:D-aminoacyl-tRNA deacylase